MKGIEEHEGKKYLRWLYSPADGRSVLVDIYAVLEAFGVTCPARQHAIKKLLCAGLRDKGSELADLIGADAAISRAIELQRIREGIIPSQGKQRIEIKTQSDSSGYEATQESVSKESEQVNTDTGMYQPVSRIYYTEKGESA